MFDAHIKSPLHRLPVPKAAFLRPFWSRAISARIGLKRQEGGHEAKARPPLLEWQTARGRLEA